MTKNIAISIRDRLSQQAKASGLPFQPLMERFVMGRLLWRLSRSESGRRFVLKGAQLFSLWGDSIHRPTRDLDLLGFGEPSVEGMKKFFTDLLNAPVDPPNDGLVWGEVHTALIREDQQYGGIRVTVMATLAGAIVPAQVDIGFGDIITPEPVEMIWHELLGFPETRLLTYPPETVIAEKLNAAVELGIANSRMKDFYDIDWLSRNMPFDDSTLRSAIRATFERRGTAMPVATPVAFTADFADNRSKVTQWNAFLKKSGLEGRSLSEVIERLRRFLEPVLMETGESTERVWHSGRAEWVIR